QQGRPPGTEADRRVQQYVQDRMEEAGLQPAFGSSYVQSFAVTDGVRPTGESSLASKGKAIAHALVPFSTSTAAPVEAPLVFVGRGIAPEGKGSGDYAGLGAKVEGKIVVALGGAPPDDPHISPAVTRPQSKLIAARDHGAVGFVLWEPDQAVAYPNHGEANDLTLPAVWVGEEGTPALLAAFGRKAKADQEAEAVAALEPGRRSRGSFQLHTPLEPVTLQTANVSGLLPGVEGGPVIVVGAHMDHLGQGTSSSLAPGVHAVHNGADDNASGSALVAELALAMTAGPAPRRTVVFAHFSGEELGLLGSRDLASRLDAVPPFAGRRVVAMLNVDMVGRLRERLTVSGVGSSPGWMALLDAAGPHGMRVLYDRALTLRSDHAPFYERGIPALFFFTELHGDYHAPGDEVVGILPEGLLQVAELVADVTRRAADGHPLPFSAPRTPAEGLVPALPGGDPATIVKVVGPDGRPEG
ncbi:MAG: M28 family peptidase, partial [Myxococcales bacterium]|nr:M28 family peptidase [Myxococcales bacterium]